MGGYGGPGLKFSVIFCSFILFFFSDGYELGGQGVWTRCHGWVMGGYGCHGWVMGRLWVQLSSPMQDSGEQC
jgi:hypothetical protein